MTVMLIFVAVIGGGLLLGSALAIAAIAVADGEFSDRFKRSGMDSYGNKYVGPWARIYDLAYSFGQWRQSSAQVAKRDAREARNKARMDERRKKFESKENQ